MKTRLKPTRQQIPLMREFKAPKCLKKYETKMLFRYLKSIVYGWIDNRVRRFH